MCAANIKRSQMRNVLILVALLSACGCKPQDSAEVAWARAALERNPQIEVLASDPSSQVLTIRVKATGTVRTVKPQDLAAAPPDLLGLSTQAASTQGESPLHTTPSTETSATASVDESVPPAEYSSPSEPATATPAPPQKQPGTTYKIDREAGQVRISGPGVSIVSEPQTKSETATTTPPSDPVVCDGRRFMHLDSRNINVSGDAVIARNGCELHITNSRITAIAGAGIIVQNATVHIANTQVKGTEASVEAGDGAKLFIRGSTFNGVLKRSDSAQISEDGANAWKSGG